MKPLLIINYKTYKEGLGENDIEISKLCDEIARKSKFEIIIAVQVSDIYKISRQVSIKVLAQHIDSIEPGANTGYILAEDVKENGAYGTLLNHSERRLDFEVLKKTLERAKKVGLKTFVCVKNVKEGLRVARLKPYAIAYEDPKLISSGIPISRTKPRSVKGFVDEIRKRDKKIILLCGAGISNSLDVASALGLGTNGVLLSSAVMKAKDKRKAIYNLSHLNGI